MNKSGLLVVFGVVALLGVTVASPTRRESVFDSSLEESEETREMMQEIRDMCRNNSGTDEAFTTLMETAQTTMMCVMSAVNVEGLMTDADLLTRENRKTFFGRYCPQLRTAYTCVNGLMNAAKPCLEEEDFTIVKALVGIYPDAVELVCKNDGELLFKLDDPKYAECVEKISNDVMECFVPFANETDNWDISHLTKDQCSSITDLRQCIKGKMDVCKVPDLIGVYDLFHNTLFRMTPCLNYIAPAKVTMLDNNSINEI